MDQVKLKNLVINAHLFILVGLLLAHLFFMFYNLEKWAIFGWDQVDNAWQAARMLIAHKYPLLGMAAKQNSGMYIGPLYYYLVSVFYFFTRLHPVASPVLSGVTSIIGFWVIYCVARNLFSPRVALWSGFIYTFSSFIIESERNQWPVNFIAPISLLLLYFLYKLISGNATYLLHVGIVAGLSFHMHVTAIFYPIIIALSLPFFPFRKLTARQVLASSGVFALFFVPQFIYYFGIGSPAGAAKYGNYFRDYYHGLHLRRVLQLAHDAFIEFEAILQMPYKLLRNAVFFYVPLFFLILIKDTSDKTKWKLMYLVGLWIIVPWIVFSTYKGEISNYYFSLQLYPAVIIFAYLTNWIWERKLLAAKIIVILFWGYYAFANTGVFLDTHEGNLTKNMDIAQQAVDQGKYINFTQGDPKSYLYFYLMYTQKRQMPYKL